MAIMTISAIKNCRTMFQRAPQFVYYTLIVFFTLLSLLFADNAKASYDYALNDTCIGKGIPYGDRAINIILTMGIAEAISEGFSLENADTAASDRPEGTECNSHSNEVRFCYNPWAIPGVYRFHVHASGIVDTLASAATNTDRCWDGGPYHTMKVSDGTKYYDGVFFQVNYIADAVCVQFMSAGLWRTLGCKYRADPPPAETPTTACFISDSCVSDATRESKHFFSVTGALVQCISESLDKIFQDTNNCQMSSATATSRDLNTSDTTRTNLFILFQQSMRKAISAALTLYVIFFSMRVVIGDHAPQKSEVFIFIIKMILVSYFALGDGIQTYLFPAFKAASTEIASIVFQAAGSRGLCEFNPNDYHDPTMSLWDAVDCRIGYYLGMNSPGTSPFVLVLAVYLLPLFFFNVVFILFLIAFAIFFTSITMYAVHVYILALIFLTLVLYLGPLFIPMVLFKKTRPYFDGWVKLLLSFTLQPAVVFAFLALILTIFDNAIYPGCEFGQKSVTVPWAPGKVYPLYYIDTSNLTPDAKEECESSFAYKIDLLSKGSASQTIDAIFITFTILNTDTVNDLFIAMVRLVLFGFIAAHFLEILTGFAAELTGGQTLQSVATSPMNFANAVTGKAASAAKGADPQKAEDVGDGMDGAGDGAGGSAPVPPG